VIKTPAAVTALLTSGRLPPAVAVPLHAEEWLVAGLAADQELTRSDMDAATRGSLALTGAFCFARSERPTGAVLRARLLLAEAAARGVGDDSGLADAVAYEPASSESGAGNAAARAGSSDRREIQEAVNAYLKYLVEHGDDPGGALPYMAIQSVGTKALAIRDRDPSLALPLLREVVAVVPARVLPFSLQILGRDLWIALIDATRLHAPGDEASTVRAARKWLPEYLLTGPQAFRFDDPVRLPTLPGAGVDDTAGPVPRAVAALAESGRLPATLSGHAVGGWGDLADDIDAALAAPDLDPDVRGPLTLAGAYAYVCFSSLVSGDLCRRAHRAMKLLTAAPRDLSGDEPSLYLHIKWQVEGAHREEEWPELLDRADAELDANGADLALAADYYLRALRAHADDYAPEGLPYGTLEHIAEKARTLSYRDEELARPLLRAVATAIPAEMLPYSVQLAIRDVWQRLGDPDSARAWLPPHLKA
jgi:hypothetical protein